jgi:hypothetical protein
VEVEASQDVAKDLGILDKLSFGDSFAAIWEALGVKDEWKTCFDAADAAKAAEAVKAAEVAKTVEVDEEMEVDDGVDEESVLSGSKKGKGRVLPRRDQVKKLAVVVPVITPEVVPEGAPVGVLMSGVSGVANKCLGRCSGSAHYRSPVFYLWRDEEVCGEEGSGLCALSRRSSQL